MRAPEQPRKPGRVRRKLAPNYAPDHRVVHGPWPGRQGRVGRA
ncbi:MAG: hypothetical protein RLZ04_1620, partial [Actinomycetota bacterium]